MSSTEPPFAPELVSADEPPQLVVVEGLEPPENLHVGGSDAAEPPIAPDLVATGRLEA